jgi:OOP family OmpA-OmpF porin
MMNRKKFIFAVAAAAVLGLLAVQGQAAELIMAEEAVVVEGKEMKFVRTADNFIILYDSSTSMAAKYKDTDMTRVEAEKQILREDNDRLPELKWNAGLYSFTPADPLTAKRALTPYYEMKQYNKAAFGQAIEQLPTDAKGATPLQMALVELEAILKGLSGRTVVFLFTDGQYSHSKGQFEPVEIARNLATRYNVCFYVISSATGETGRLLLEQVAGINECSRVVPFDDLLGKPYYFTGALFALEEELVAMLEPREQVVGLEMPDILFDFNKSNIKAEFQDEMDALGKFLQDHGKAYVVLSGFTDNVGSQEYNLGLSRRRAVSVAAYLIDRFGIDGSRIVTQWYGEAHPLYSNDTEEGRYKNRRVEVIVAGMIQ